MGPSYVLQWKNEACLCTTPDAFSNLSVFCSGAGKTSLLNILAGRATSNGRVKITTDIRLNNFLVDPSKIAVRRQIAFVAQDDSLQVTSTPREAIRFSAKLRLPRSTTDSQLDKLTQRMLNELGLTNCADVRIFWG